MRLVFGNVQLVTAAKTAVKHVTQFYYKKNTRVPIINTELCYF